MREQLLLMILTLVDCWNILYSLTGLFRFSLGALSFLDEDLTDSYVTSCKGARENR
jgi:hypothetical protein